MTENHKSLKSKLYSLFLKVYQAFPFKKSLLLIVKFLGIPNKKFYRDIFYPGVLKIKYRDISFKIQGTKSSIENELFWNGLNNWERDSIWLWAELVEKSEVIFDVGANTGVYSLLAKSLKANAEVFAFEPSLRTFQLLSKNAQLNSYDIHCSDVALSNIDGEQTFYDVADTIATSATLSKEMGDSKAEPHEKQLTYTVKTQQLDSFISDSNLTQLDLMKMDVEMHEPEVMEGFQSIKILRPIIFIEILSEEIAQAIEKHLIDAKYKYFELKFQQLISIPHLKMGRPKFWNFLLVPEEKVNLISKFID